MRTQRTKTLALAPLCLALALSATTAAAAPTESGAVISASRLKRDHRLALKTAIDKARVADARAFKTLGSLRAALPSLARRQRGRLVSVVLPLRALGRAALLPMLSELAFESTGRGGLSARAWQGWRVSLLEAVGSLGDPRSAPVLEAIVTGEEPDVAVVRSAARALAWLRSDGAARFLLTLSRGRDARRRRAVLAVLGECRRPDVARALVAMVRTTADDTDRSLVVRALGQLGNLWAWRTLGGPTSAEGAATRLAALEGLIVVYPTLGRADRQAAAKAVVLIGHPETLARITAARAAATGARRAALAELALWVNQVGLLR